MLSESGVRIPSLAAEGMSLDALLLPVRAMVDPDLNTEPPHLKGGDFRPSRLYSLFDEWIPAMRMWEPTDPSAPPYDAGSALDEFLFAPDIHIPFALFKNVLSCGLDVEEVGGGRFFPAAVFPHFAISDHFSIALQIPLAAFSNGPPNCERA